MKVKQRRACFYSIFSRFVCKYDINQADLYGSKGCKILKKVFKTLKGIFFQLRIEKKPMNIHRVCIISRAKGMSNTSKYRRKSLSFYLKTIMQKAKLKKLNMTVIK